MIDWLRGNVQRGTLYPSMTTMGLNLSNPKGVAEFGEKIYAERYRSQYEQTHLGWFVVIDVLTGKAYLAENSEQALGTARSEAPRGIFHLIQVGRPGAFRVGYSRHANDDMAWLFR